MNISYKKFSITIIAEEELYLPYYTGSTFRGGFGNAFRRIACVLKIQDCLNCMLKSKCIYSYIFETPSDNGAEIMNMHKYEKVPHPFIIEPPLINSKLKPTVISPPKDSKIIQPGTSIDLNLVLIGKAIDFLPYFIFTFEQLGNFGIGKSRGRFRIDKIEEVKKDGDKTYRETVYTGEEKTIKKSEPDIIHLPDDFKPSGGSTMVTLNFLTPLRIKYNRNLVVKPEFHIFMRSLLRRLALLSYFHCGGQKPQFNHREIIGYAEGVKIRSNSLRWFDWERYSSRQDTRMRLGGLIGEVTYEGDITPFIPFLKAGEILHIGKATTFGLGRYEIV